MRRALQYGVIFNKPEQIRLNSEGDPLWVPCTIDLAPYLSDIYKITILGSMNYNDKINHVPKINDLNSMETNDRHCDAAVVEGSLIAKSKQNIQK